MAKAKGPGMIKMGFYCMTGYFTGSFAVGQYYRMELITPEIPPALGHEMDPRRAAYPAFSIRPDSAIRSIPYKTKEERKLEAEEYRAKLRAIVDEGKVNTSSETQRIIALTEEERDAEFNRKMEAVQERLKNWSLLGGSKDGGSEAKDGSDGSVS